MKKRKAAWVFAVMALTVGLFLSAVQAEEEREIFVCGDYVYALLDDGTAEIVRCGYDQYMSDLDVPSELDGHPVTAIGDHAFSGYKRLYTVTIPDSITGISANPFQECEFLATINVSPDHPTLATIDGVLFSKPDKRLISYPRNLKASEYSIPQGIKVIGDSAFYACTNLTSVTIPDSVVSIGNDAFSRCKSLSSVAIPGSVADIGDRAFSQCYSLADIEIPDGVATIGEGAFSQCINLASITIPDGVANIGEKAFYGCAITSFAVPEGVTAIGALTFGECRKLTDVEIPESVTAIGLAAFSTCINLTAFTIPDGVTDIGDMAFTMCRRLTVVTIPDSVTNIGANPFDSCPALEMIQVSPDHPTLTFVDGALISKSDMRLISFLPGFLASEYPELQNVEITIPQGIEIIGDQAFYTAYGYETASITISSVVIPDGVTEIGDSAFSFSSLTAVTIPDSVTSIADSAFSYCSSLASVVVGRDSYAREYCIEHDLPYTYADADDWLND